MTERTDAGHLDAAQAALRRSDWQAARAGFRAALERDRHDPGALDGLGRSLWWLGNRRDAIARRREAYDLYWRRGDALAAAKLATYLAAEHRLAGDPVAAGGWLARAERLLEGAGVCAERGWLEIERAKRAAADPRAHADYATAAATIARQLGDPDLEAAALAQLGLARLDAGEIDPGMKLLDEAMTIATSQASDPDAIGDTCTTTLIACARLADFTRAAAWCRVVVEFTGRRGYAPVHLWGRTIYAGVLITTGDWERAERELASALRGYDTLAGVERVHALNRLVDLRVRQGRLGEARALLRGQEDDPAAATAAAALALALGEHELALARITQRLAGIGDDKAEIAGLLPALVDIRIATRDLDVALETAGQLRELAERLARSDLLAFAAYGDARVAALRGSQNEALAGLELAMAAFGRHQMPLEEARARLALARLESGELALLHARTALTTFERLDAALDADAAGALMRDLGISGRGAPRIGGELTAREREVLELLGEGLTNQAIAERLFISPRTAEHHVGRILGKLGLRRRAEAAAYVVRGGRV